MGPDRAAAEWILRLGGSVKFGSYESWTTDYNRMPAEPRDRVRLEAIDASGVSITNNGLEHLGENMCNIGVLVHVHINYNNIIVYTYVYTYSVVPYKCYLYRHVHVYPYRCLACKFHYCDTYMYLSVI